MGNVSSNLSDGGSNRMINRYIDILSRHRKRIIGGIFCLGILSIVAEAGASITPLIFLLLILSFWIPKDRGSIKLISELMALLNTGYTLTESLELLGHYQPRYKKRLARIANDVRNGSGFAEACKRRLRFFPSILIRVIKEGETRGALPLFLKTYLDYYDLESSFSRAINNAIAYPAMVFGICFFSGCIMLIFVLPAFSEMFASFGKDLPLMTRVTMNLGGLIKYLVILVLLIGIVYLLKRIMTKRGFFNRLQIKLDAFLLMLFTRDIVDDGGSLGEALTVSARIQRYKKYIKAADSLSNKVKNGTSWLDSLKQGSALPPDLVTAVASGSVAGDMPKTLGLFIFGLREQYSIQANRSSRRVEFTLILFNILLWGFIIISMYLPIFRMAGNI